MKILSDDRLKHIAIIMDGNGRWAKKRGLPREFGHKYGADAFYSAIFNVFTMNLPSNICYEI